MLAEAGQTPTNYWSVSCLAAVELVVLSILSVVAFNDSDTEKMFSAQPMDVPVSHPETK